MVVPSIPLQISGLPLPQFQNQHPDPHTFRPPARSQQSANFPMFQLSQIFGTYSRLSICANLMFGYFYKN
jgi:hypothetical protein